MSCGDPQKEQQRRPRAGNDPPRHYRPPGRGPLLPGPLHPGADGACRGIVSRFQAVSSSVRRFPDPPDQHPQGQGHQGQGRPALDQFPPPLESGEGSPLQGQGGAPDEDDGGPRMERGSQEGRRRRLSQGCPLRQDESRQEGLLVSRPQGVHDPVDSCHQSQGPHGCGGGDVHQGGHAALQRPLPVGQNRYPRQISDHPRGGSVSGKKGVACSRRRPRAQQGRQGRRGPDPPTKPHRLAPRRTRIWGTSQVPQYSEGAFPLPREKAMERLPSPVAFPGCPSFQRVST